MMETRKKIYYDFYVNQRQIELQIESAYYCDEELTILVLNEEYDEVESPEELRSIVLQNYSWLVQIYLWMLKQDKNFDQDRVTCLINESCLLIAVSKETKTEKTKGKATRILREA